MKPAGSTILHRALRTISALLSFTILFNQSARAATIHQVPTAAQTPQAPAPAQAPVPTQIAAARSIFLVNNGADTNFPLSAQDAYNRVYSALQAWGHFQLVASPDQADLVFQLRDIAPITGVYGDRTGAYAINSPAFQLAIKDPKTNVTLWTINSPVEVAGRKAAESAGSISPSPTSSAASKSSPTSHSTKPKPPASPPIPTTTAPALPSALIGHHRRCRRRHRPHHEAWFDNSVANQNAALCAQNPFFCN